MPTTLRRCTIAALGLCLSCIGSPVFHPFESGASDDMALIPRTTLTTSVLAPATQADPKEKPPKKPKDNDKEKGAGSVGDPDAGDPTTTTTVGPFWLDIREVSAEGYAGCVTAGVCTASAGACVSASLADGPAQCVTRDEASAYCAWRGKRLVQRDEWVAAATGPSARPFPWGAAAPSSDRLNACGAECASPGLRPMYTESDRFVAAAPRGSFLNGRTPEGVFDLAGNVAEWVAAPTGMVFGGSYADVDVVAVGSLAFRDVDPTVADSTIGFRCARAP